MQVGDACEPAGNGAAGHATDGDEEERESDVESYDDADGSDYGSADVTESGRQGEGEGAPGGTRVGGSSRGPGRPGSIASTYWREERHDRKELLAVIDERCVGRAQPGRAWGGGGPGPNGGPLHACL